MTAKAARLIAAVASRSVTDSALLSPTAATAATSGGTEPPFSGACCCRCCWRWSSCDLPRRSGDVPASSSWSTKCGTGIAGAVVAGDTGGFKFTARCLGVLWPLLLLLLPAGAGVSGEGGVGDGDGVGDLVASDPWDGVRTRPDSRSCGRAGVAAAAPSFPFLAEGEAGGGRRCGVGRCTGESGGLLAGAPPPPLPSRGKLACSRGDDASRGGLLAGVPPPLLPSLGKMAWSRGDAALDGLLGGAHPFPLLGKTASSRGDAACGGLLVGDVPPPLPSLWKLACSRGDASSGGLLVGVPPPLPSPGKLACSRGDASSDGGGVWYSSPGCDEGDGDGEGDVSRGGGAAGAGTDTGTGGGGLSGAGVRGVDGMVCDTARGGWTDGMEGKGSIKVKGGVVRGGVAALCMGGYV